MGTQTQGLPRDEPSQPTGPRAGHSPLHKKSGADSDPCRLDRVGESECDVRPGRGGHRSGGRDRRSGRTGDSFV